MNTPTALMIFTFRTRWKLAPNFIPLLFFPTGNSTGS